MFLTKIKNTKTKNIYSVFVDFSKVVSLVLVLVFTLS